MLTSSKYCFVIPTYNSAKTIQETIDSILCTSRSAVGSSIEIVVLDGGSTDTTEYICKELACKYSRLKFFVRPREHPGERVNTFIKDQTYTHAMICHSDDVYDTEARLEVLKEMIELNHFLRGSQHGYFQSPVDALLDKRDNPYTGAHLSYPHEPQQITAELPFWHCFSLNTVALNLEAIHKEGIFYEWSRFKYCADYLFNWSVARLGKASNSRLVTTITRHDRNSDGPTHLNSIHTEALKIRQLIAFESGLLNSFNHVDKIAFEKVNYSYGVIHNSKELHAIGLDWLSLFKSISHYAESQRNIEGHSKLLSALQSCISINRATPKDRTIVIIIKTLLKELRKSKFTKIINR